MTQMPSVLAIATVLLFFCLALYIIFIDRLEGGWGGLTELLRSCSNCAGWPMHEGGIHGSAEFYDIHVEFKEDTI